MTTSGQALLRQLAVLRGATDIGVYEDAAVVSSMCHKLRPLIESDTAAEELVQQHQLMKQVAIALARAMTVLWENLGQLSTCADVYRSLRMLVTAMVAVCKWAHVAADRDARLLLLARQLAESGMPAKLQPQGQYDTVWLVLSVKHDLMWLNACSSSKGNRATTLHATQDTLSRHFMLGKLLR
jgi:hypothetical protein